MCYDMWKAKHRNPISDPASDEPSTSSGVQASFILFSRPRKASTTGKMLVLLYIKIPYFLVIIEIIE